MPSKISPLNSSLIANRGEAAPMKSGGRAVTVTVKLDPALYRKLKMYGVDRRQTNQDILVEALTRLLAAST
ncbi:MAG TPA: hypothetical protein VMS08_01170 [Candidatus Saccharimonadia bacterium]|nr:hypothetical protein [Candidatus Saccharimonadia bacterium]